MPVYTVRCPSCGAQDDVYLRLADFDKLPRCEDCETRTERVITAPMVMPDLGEYQAVAVDVATGKPPQIRGRKQHREFLKRNGYVEVGNEMPAPKPFRYEEKREAVRAAIAEATKEVLAQPGHVK